MSAEGELNLRLTGKAKEPAFAKLLHTFEQTWKKDSVPLNAYIAERFKSIAQRSATLAGQIDPKIWKLLKTVHVPDLPNGDGLPPIATKMTFCDGWASAKTAKLLRSNTPWEKKGWHWMVYTGRTQRDKLRSAGSFYLAQVFRDGSSLSLVDVRGYEDLKTEDGRYFVAYQRRKGSIAKRLDRATLSGLKEELPALGSRLRSSFNQLTNLFFLSDAPRSDVANPP